MVVRVVPGGHAVVFDKKGLTLSARGIFSIAMRTHAATTMLRGLPVERCAASYIERGRIKPRPFDSQRNPW